MLSVDNLSGTNTQMTLEERRKYDSLASEPVVINKKNPDSATGQLFVDEDRLLSKSNFNIKPDKLIELTKEILATQFAADSNCLDYLADDFEFCGPSVGPFGK